jgi:hypothetical protein
LVKDKTDPEKEIKASNYKKADKTLFYQIRNHKEKQQKRPEQNTKIFKEKCF